MPRLTLLTGGGGVKYEPSFNPLPPLLLSLAKTEATDAQQRQHSWSACKRKGDMVREGRGGACTGRPLPPTLGAPLVGHLPWPHAPVPPKPTAGPSRRWGGRTRAGGRTPWSGAGAAAADGAHSPRRPGAPRSRCGARWEPPPLTSPARRAEASPPPTACAPSFCRRRLRSCRPRLPAGHRGLPRPGLARAWERKRPGDFVRACPRACPPVCVSVWVCASV